MDNARPMPADPLEELARMPGDLERLAAELAGESGRTRPPDGSFSFVERVWHLADLEKEGFAERIRLLSTEDDRSSPISTVRIARERDYRSLAVADGLAAFSRARAANLAALRSLTERARPGVQEGVGPDTLAEIPGRMIEHDRAHRAARDADAASPGLLISDRPPRRQRGQPSPVRRLPGPRTAIQDLIRVGPRRSSRRRLPLPGPSDAAVLLN